ncbi:hypothetical protein ACSHT0_12845 [Tepidicaulis sp. LMO-SS28]|uniref:hypothetical protein n=1 Tax=Tepidicaulis sp. LMO-SS28 TaxID=3447455 RepID=UPI003EE3884A
MWLFDRRQIAPLAFLMIAALGLAGCGFQPLYADRTGGAPVKAKLEAITIEAPGGEVGNGLKFNLEDLIGERGVASTRYSLRLSPQVRESNVAVRQDTEVTRRNVRLTTRFDLYDSEVGEVVLSGSSTSTGSYNRVDSEFANLMAYRNVEDRVIRDTAQDLYTRLSIYFQRQPRS